MGSVSTCHRRDCGNTGHALLLSLAMGALAMLCLHGCAKKSAPVPLKDHPKPYQINGIWYQPIPDARGFSQQGIASWYGEKFHGRRTANGEIYDMFAMTAAHKTLPLGTWVRVRHRHTDRQIVVRINDRGPFVHGRVIDLSYTAAKALGVVEPGTAPVEVVALGERRRTASGDAFVPVDLFHGAFTFQVGAFSSKDNAENLRAKLDKSFTNAHITTYDRGDVLLYRVRVGRCSDLDAAEQYERRLAASGYPDVFMVAE